MITEDYVSFETAKLLKEKGFNYPCRVVYSPKGIVKHYLKEEVYAHHLKGHKKLCPTLQMAVKWLREVYSINFNISWNPTFKDYFVEIFKPTLLYSTITYQNYEEACEAAIKYCLENLINKKEGNT